MLLNRPPRHVCTLCAESESFRLTLHLCRLNCDATLRTFQQGVRDTRPPIVGFAALAELASGKSSRQEILAVVNHQFPALLFVQQVEEAYFAQKTSQASFLRCECNRCFPAALPAPPVGRAGKLLLVSP
jgi:hypothetical protein